MKKLLVAVVIAMLIVPTTAPVSAQTLFRNDLKDKYDHKTVSCYVCHARVKREDLKPGEVAKQFKNDLGKLFEKEMAGVDATKKLEKVKKLKRDDPNRVAVEEAMSKAFLAALEKIEAMDAPEGGTYADAFKEGKIEGIKLR